MKKHINKFVAFSGVFWFTTDALWFNGFTGIALITGILTLISTLLLFVIDNKVRLNVVLNCWVMLNTCFLVSDHFKDILEIVIFAKFAGIVVIVVAIPVMLGLIVHNKNYLNNIRKL